MSSKKKNQDQDIFRQAMADVTPLRADDRIEPEPAKTPPRAIQQDIDNREALRELMDDRYLDDIETGEELLWLKPGYSQRVLKRLRRGHYSTGDTIDLHHMDVETAKQVLLDFIESALRRNLGCVRIIHGKGLRSRDLPRLKVMTNRILFKHPRVVAYASCRPVDGGTGATNVLLSSPTGVRK
jgi:DNA-nicking Smr family endonuclease